MASVAFDKHGGAVKRSACESPKTHVTHLEQDDALERGTERALRRSFNRVSFDATPEHAPHATHNHEPPRVDPLGQRAGRLSWRYVRLQA